MIRIATAALGASLLLAGCQQNASEQQPAPAPANDAAPVPGAATAVPDYVSTALADSSRAAQAGNDARRKAGEVIAFSGLKPGDKVLDLIPGDGYWTRIFSKIVGPNGHVYAVFPQAYAKEAQGNVGQMKQLAGSPGYANVSFEVQPTNALTAPEPLDMVWTSQNYHDYPDAFMGKTDPSVLNKAVFAALKPGGTWFIIDHAAEPGSGMRDTDTLHRIDPAIVRQQVEAAGFQYVGESEALRNPADTHKVKVFDPTVRGHTDQFVMKFRKPA